MMNKFMMSCKEVTQLMEKKREEKLSIKERMELFIHSMMCDACREFEKQSRILETFIKARKEAHPESEIEFNSKELEEKILQKINKNPRTHDDRKS